MTDTHEDTPLTRRGVLELLSGLFGSKDADSTAFKSVGNHWFARWSNNFEDRDGEIFTAKAIDDYVTRVDNGRVPLPDLWVWHAGENVKVGKGAMVGRHEHFLIASGTWDDTPRGQAAKVYYSRNAAKTSISHGFTYDPALFDGKHYHAFNTFEISLLPRGKEANRFTSLERMKAMTLTDEKRKYLTDVFGPEEVAGILSDLEKKGKALEDLGVAYKDFTGSEPPTADAEKAATDAVDAGVKALVTELVSDVATTIDTTKAFAQTVVERIKAQDDVIAKQAETIAELKAAFDERPQSASQSDKSALTAENIATMIDTALKQEKASADSFWGAPTTEA